MKRDLKVRISFLLIVLMILMGMPTAAFAGSISNLNVERIEGNDVTKDIQMKVQITNNNAEVEEGDTIDPTKDMTMKVDFSIPDTLILKAGDYMQVELPEYLRFSNLHETEIYMKVGDGQVLLGNVTVSGSKAILTFADSAQNEEYSGRAGWFSAGLSFDKTKVETSEDKVVVTILGNDFTILVKDPDKGVISLKKSGKGDIAKEEIIWTITATPSKEDKKYDGYVLKDTLPSNTSYVKDSFEIKPSALNKDNLKIDEAQGTIEYTFDKDVKGIQTITYKTKIKDVAKNNNKDMTITNNVSLTDPDTTTSAAATVTVKPQLISKSGTYIVSNHSVNWTINVNSNKATLKNVVVTDELAPEMTLGDIIIEKNKLTNDVTKPQYYTLNGQTVKIHLGDIDKKVVIKLNTTLDNTIKAKVTNKATITWNDKGSSITGGNDGSTVLSPVDTQGQVDITSGFITKSAIGKYDFKENEMPWQITINSAQKEIKNATVVELFAYNKDEVSKINSAPNSSKFDKYKGNAITLNQKYIAGTLKIDGSEGIKISENAEFSQKGQYRIKTIQLNSTVEAQIVEVYVGDIEEKQEVTLNTKVTDKTAYGVNSKSTEYILKNTAYLYYGDGNSPLSASAKEKHYSCILDKDCAVGYNYVDYTITWRLYVNHNSLNIEDGVITDTLPKYWDVNGDDFYEIYKGKDFKLGGGIATIENGDKLTADEVKALVKEVKVTEKDDVRTIQFEFNKISSKYVILIKTKLPDQAALDKQFAVNGDVTIRNNAAMTGESISGSQGDWEDVTIKNSLVSKTGALDKDSKGNYTGDATWTIDVNRNAIHLPTDELSKVYVIDKLQNYLEPKMENGNYKIRIWEMKLKEDGSWDKADEVPQETVQSGISYKDKELRIKLTKTDGSYRIELVTRLTSDTVTEINNTAFLEGVKTDIVSKNETIKIEYADGGAWANLAGKIILTKMAEKTGILLEGAVFQLYEISDDSKPVETLKYTKVTDKKGMIQFGRLNSGKYKLVEVTAPVGYEIDKDSASRIIELDTSNNDTRIVNLNITNKPLLRVIQLLKMDDLGKALPGAEFTLYKKAIANENAIAKSESAVNGSVTFNNVAMGEYYIAETKAPTGYSASTAGAIVKAVVDKDGKVSYFAGDNFANAVTDVPTIKNEAYKGNVIISKTDKTGSPLKGAEFTLYDENEKVVAKAVSEGDKGIAKFENIRFGDYIIKETSAPAGYIASDKVINITEKDFVKNNVELAYTVENEKRLDGGSSGGSHNKPTNPEEKPQVNIPDEEVPLNNATEDSPKADPIIIENQETPLGEGTIEDENVPLGKLPATGGIGEEIFFGFGAGLVALGAGLRRKVNKEK